MLAVAAVIETLWATNKLERQTGREKMIFLAAGGVRSGGAPGVERARVGELAMDGPYLAEIAVLPTEFIPCRSAEVWRTVSATKAGQRWWINLQPSTTQRQALTEPA